MTAVSHITDTTARRIIVRELNDLQRSTGFGYAWVCNRPLAQLALALIEELVPRARAARNRTLELTEAEARGGRGRVLDFVFNHDPVRYEPNSAASWIKGLILRPDEKLSLQIEGDITSLQILTD